MYISNGDRRSSTQIVFEMLKIVVVLSALALAGAQLPNLGWCPEYVPMANFDMNRFLGTWYEAERYFQLSELVSRCVMANYTKGNDGRFRVSNEVTNRFTGVKRVLDGEIKPSASKADEGKLHVRYTTVPLTPETQYSVLETDYKNYAVLWSCSGFGPVHTQNAWIMTRQRLPPGEILQKAYGVLDKYKISKTFFVKTDQDDCVFLASLPSESPAEVPQSDQPHEEDEEQRNVVSIKETETEAAEIKAPEAVVKAAPAILKSAATPVESAVVPETAAVPESAAVPQSSAVPESAAAPKSSAVPESPAVSETVAEVPAQFIKVAEPVLVEEKGTVPPAPETVPELILKVADQAKEVVVEAIKKIEAAPKEAPKKEEIIIEAEKITV